YPPPVPFPGRSFMSDAPLVSALCITCNRVNHLRRAVACFQAQTHPNKELVALYHKRDAPTRAFLLSLDDARIRPVEVDLNPIPPFGSLRNASIEHARGEYIAVWDDDDWSDPSRLAVQMEALRASRKTACMLKRLRVYDQPAGGLYQTRLPRRWAM